MPVRRGEDSSGPYYQWGSGKRYHYTPGNAQARERARRKAAAQGRAAHASGYKG